MGTPTIFVDADACPVKDEVERVAHRHNLPVVYVANHGARPSRDPLIRHVAVPATPDAADNWIVDNLQPADIVITADILLAGRAVALSALVLGPNGHRHSPDSIGMAVAMRNLRQQLREAGQDRGINATFGPRDRAAFLQSMHETAQEAIRLKK